MKKSTANTTNLAANFAHDLKMGELAGRTAQAVENLHLLRDLVSRGESGEPLHLSFNATLALTRLLDQFAMELEEVSELLAEA